jgi:ankyrin repeat protein
VLLSGDGVYNADREEAEIEVSILWIEEEHRADGIAGWTPLHLSALISTPPLISFLLTRGASPSDITNRGLTPLDLVAGMPDRMHISALLEQASNQGTSASALVPAYAKLSEGRQRLLRRRRDRAGRESSRQEERERRKKREAERERWVREKVEIIGIDPGILFSQGPENTSASSRDSGIDMTADSDDSDTEESDTPNTNTNVCVFIASLGTS